MIKMDTSYNSTHAVITRVLINVHSVDIVHAYKCMCVHVSDTTVNYNNTVPPLNSVTMQTIEFCLTACLPASLL